VKDTRIVRGVAVAVVASALGFGLAADGHAQATQQPRDRDQMQQRDTREGDRARRPGTAAEQRQTFQVPADAVESKRLVGTRVKDPQGKDIGEIDQLIVDSKEGRITHAVIGVGGFLGIGETHVVVPWSDVRVTRDQENRDQMIVRMDQATLERAPRYERVAGRDRERAPATSPRTEPGRTGTTDTSPRDRAPGAAQPPGGPTTPGGGTGTGSGGTGGTR
jgi:sporulation protein YlmC with PRC-barrel domain